ncbi:hypothetical protein DERP_010110 [Dermatophagoides pteronyssinus]|uniref:Uncharacterized protein n=1 Tax=Dermatophagoides pteronyssinus TaxID=6956 RepID=A0ABQ8JEY1_DERPT|nr:hypothetical protein DERP_010110 [Dermatophagoides pteronyssinus]
MKKHGPNIFAQQNYNHSWRKPFYFMSDTIINSTQSISNCNLIKVSITFYKICNIFFSIKLNYDFYENHNPNAHAQYGINVSLQRCIRITADTNRD